MMDVDTRTPSRAEEPDPRQSLQHVLAPSNGHAEARPAQAGVASTPGSTKRSRGAAKEPTEEERSVQSDSYSRAADINPSYTMTVVHSRRNANGTIGSVYSGNKIRHLKKEDGVPLWRKDIQFSFLKAVFEDKTRVFTAMDGTKNLTFADIYIQAMAKSSKTSRILMQKLLTEREAAVNMAMICLLVNVGRMNTTLNFFPEMRAQLRTYHSIPCLQAHQDPNAYKQLQDAPRLKSILKGACEDSEQPNSIEKIQEESIPRTNPVNLIFVLSQYAPKISETHFFQPRDFFDLVIRSTLSSKSRAKAFLWLIWWYLESNFSEADALDNPFGPGLRGDDPDGPPVKVPAFEALTEEQANAENVDTEEEKKYGEMKRLERKRILEDDETVGPPVKKSTPRHAEGMDDKRNGSPRRSDFGPTRSPSPVGASLWLPKPPGRGAESRKLTGFRHENRGGTPRSDYEKASRLIAKSNRGDPQPDSSPAPTSGFSAFRHAGPTGGRRSRPETSHQKAVNRNRQLRIDNILHKKLVATQAKLRRTTARRLRPFGYRAMSRIVDLPDDYDTDDAGGFGPGGLVPSSAEGEDFGGEARALRKVIERALRRLAREEGGAVSGAGGRKRKFEALEREGVGSGDGNASGNGDGAERARKRGDRGSWRGIGGRRGWDEGDGEDGEERYGDGDGEDGDEDDESGPGSEGGDGPEGSLDGSGEES